VAVITSDLERFLAFYGEVFGMSVLFQETTPAFRHAIVRSGENSWLHPAALADNAHGAGLPDMFRRGHLDHLALTAASREAFELVRTSCRSFMRRSRCRRRPHPPRSFQRSTKLLR
jgi:catechol 2,3-dioxygenase-like lactoylglutathione lyase family enzyme